ncbi:MAG TPA: phosphate acyltransferase PlsX [Planctomycetota bacterium]|nr:phosphate acyltransferase PlsX [Planctomycetota bacterium]
MSPERIALDVMGGDHAPKSTLDGLMAACDPAGSRALDPGRFLLVGDRESMARELEARGAAGRFELAHASEVVGMAEAPAVALRSKPDSSIVVGVGLVRAGRAGAFVSMGNTGAVVGASTLGLKTLEGVKRPAIAVTLNLTGRPVTLLDMGANGGSKPSDLAQNALMGSVYSRDCLGVAEPRVALLNIGAEPGKGTELLKEAYPLLEAAPVNFVGNIEGHDLFGEVADVVVTDGFTGNVVLKLLESFSVFMLGLVLKELKSHQVQWAPEALAHIKTKIDYAEYGGALLLGVRGIVVKGHGRSDSGAVANALGQAAAALDARVNEHIVKGLEA